MDEADTYGFDGINLDFESLKEEAGVHYIQFIRELSVACRKKGLVLSVDNYVPAPYNRFYNRREQGIVADYVIIMGYDEHYAGGDAGSVASLGYVEKGIKDTLELVPKEKLINGVPFFTRLWTEKDGKFSSKAMGLGNAKSGLRIMACSSHGTRPWGSITVNAIRPPERIIFGWRMQNLWDSRWI